MKSEELRKLSHGSSIQATESRIKEIDKFIEEMTPHILKKFDDELMEMALSGRMIYRLEIQALFREKFSFFYQMSKFDEVYWECLFTPKFNELLVQWATDNSVYVNITEKTTEEHTNQWKITLDIRKHSKIYQLWRRIISGNEYLRIFLISEERLYYAYKKAKRQQKNI